MKNLAIFHPSAELYGADRIMVNAAQCMNEFNITIYLPKSGDLVQHIQENLPDAKIKIITFMPLIQRSMLSPKGIFSALKVYLKFVKFVKGELSQTKPDLIYINTLACSLCLPALRKLNCKIITHVHEIIDNPVFVAKTTAKIANKYSNNVICVSKAVYEGIIKHLGSKTSKVLVLRNGIAPVKKLAKTPNSKVEFYLFGRIKPEKGHWYLIEALKHIHPNILKFAHFNLVGGTVNGKEYLIEEINQLLAINKLSEFVSIKGFTKNITPLISMADVCLIPSLMKDPFPTTVLEAMSIGKMIITTDTGGAKEAIVDGQSGIIIPADSPELFARAIESLITNREFSNNMGSMAMERFNNHFTIEHFQYKWREMIRELFSQIGNDRPVLHQSNQNINQLSI